MLGVYVISTTTPLDGGASSPSSAKSDKKASKDTRRSAERTADKKKAEADEQRIIGAVTNLFTAGHCLTLNSPMRIVAGLVSAPSVLLATMAVLGVPGTSVAMSPVLGGPRFRLMSLTEAEFTERTSRLEADRELSRARENNEGERSGSPQDGGASTTHVKEKYVRMALLTDPSTGHRVLVARRSSRHQSMNRLGVSFAASRVTLKDVDGCSAFGGLVHIPLVDANSLSTPLTVSQVDNSSLREQQKQQQQNLQRFRSVGGWQLPHAPGFLSVPSTEPTMSCEGSSPLPPPPVGTTAASTVDDVVQGIPVFAGGSTLCGFVERCAASLVSPQTTAATQQQVSSFAPKRDKKKKKGTTTTGELLAESSVASPLPESICGSSSAWKLGAISRCEALSSSETSCARIPFVPFRGRSIVLSHATFEAALKQGIFVAIRHF
jgi:hypothetical protein